MPPPPIAAGVAPAAEGALQVARLLHLGACGRPGHLPRVVGLGPFRGGQGLGHLLEHLLALLRGQLGERLGVRLLDLLRGRRAQQVPVAGDGRSVLRGGSGGGVLRAGRIPRA